MAVFWLKLDKDKLVCAVQKPISKSKSFDTWKTHAGDECCDYIVETIKELILDKTNND